MFNFFILFGSCTLAQSKANFCSFLDRDGIFVFFRASTLILAPIQSLTEWQTGQSVQGLKLITQCL